MRSKGLVILKRGAEGQVEVERLLKVKSFDGDSR